MEESYRVVNHKLAGILGKKPWKADTGHLVAEKWGNVPLLWRRTLG